MKTEIKSTTEILLVLSTEEYNERYAGLVFKTIEEAKIFWFTVYPELPFITKTISKTELIQYWEITETV